MNKVFVILLAFIVMCLNCFSQTLTPPNTPGVTGRSTLPVEDRYLFVRQHFGLPRYSDTTQANIYNGLQDTCGAVIFTYDAKALWFRSCSPKKWIQILPSGSPTGLLAWLLGGVDVSARPDSAVHGTTSYDDWYLISNDRKFLGFSKDSILPYNPAVKPLGRDSITKMLSFANPSGGGGGSGTVTSVTGSAPIIITGTPTTVPNVTADTSTANTGLATLYQANLRWKKTDTLSRSQRPLYYIYNFLDSSYTLAMFEASTTDSGWVSNTTYNKWDSSVIRATRLNDSTTRYYRANRDSFTVVIPGSGGGGVALSAV